MPTIKDVAQTAGLSTAVISKYLRDARSVRPETRVRIEAAIARHNYKPSRLARALRTGKTGFISVAIPEIKNPFFAEIYDALMTCGVERELIPILETLDHRVKPRTNLLIDEIDGMIACFLEDEAIVSLLGELSSRIPVVTIGYDRQLSGGSAVIIDLAKGMMELTEHLVRSGRRRFAYVGESTAMHSSVVKFEAFSRALLQQGIPLNAQKVCRNYTGFDGGYAATCALLTGDQPDAIILETDTLAVGCMKRLLQLRINIPGQIAVTGFDNIPLSGTMEPALTTVHIPTEEISRHSIALLMAMIEGSDRQGDVHLSAELVVREST